MNVIHLISEVFKRGVTEGAFRASQGSDFRSAVANILFRVGKSSEIPLRNIAKSTEEGWYIMEAKLPSADSRVYAKPVVLALNDVVAAEEFTIKEHAVWEHASNRSLLDFIHLWLKIAEGERVVSFFNSPHGDIGTLHTKVLDWGWPNLLPSENCTRIKHLSIGIKSCSVNAILQYNADEEILWINERDISTVEVFLCR